MGKSLCRIFWLVSEKEKTKYDKFIHLLCKGRNWCLWALLPKWCRITAFCWKSSANFQEEKCAVIGFKTIIEREENEEARVIYGVGSYRFVSFFTPSLSWDYNQRLQYLCSKNCSLSKPRRWRWCSPTPWKITVMFIFLYHTINLHFPETIKE